MKKCSECKISNLRIEYLEKEVKELEIKDRKERMYIINCYSKTIESHENTIKKLNRLLNKK